MREVKVKTNKNTLKELSDQIDEIVDKMEKFYKPDNNYGAFKLKLREELKSLSQNSFVVGYETIKDNNKNE